MRGRRSSATSASHHQVSPSITSSSPSAFTPPSKRATRSSESIHEFAVVSRTQVQSGQAAETKIVSVLVGRLVNKLPCNSGICISVVEVDPVVQQTVQALVKVSEHRLEVVALSLVSVLDGLIKGTASTLASTPLEILQSQLFITITLSTCLRNSWQSHVQFADFSNSSQDDLSGLWPDPRPLDETLVKHILNVMTAIARHIHANPAGRDQQPTASLLSLAQNPLTNYLTHTPSSSSLGKPHCSPNGSPALNSQSSKSTSKPVFTAFEPVSSCRDDEGRRNSEQGMANTLPAVAVRLVMYVARIVFHVSASNWPVLLSRVKARAHYLGSLGETTTGDEGSELAELRLLQWANLDRVRLGHVLQEIAAVFLHINRTAQPAMAHILRTVVWNWVDVHPGEYIALIEKNRKLEGGADVLFDILHSLTELDPSSSSTSESQTRLKALYPAMAALLAVCPEALKRVVIAEMSGERPSPGPAKKMQFLETLRKATKSPKMAEVVMRCYADLARAALTLPGRLETSGLRSLVPEIRSDLKNFLLLTDRSHESLDDDLQVDILVVLYRLNPSDTIATVVPRLFAEQSPVEQKKVVVKAAEILAIDGNRMSWHPSIDQLHHVIGLSLGRFVKMAVRDLVGDRLVGQPAAIRPASQAAMDLSQFLSAALNLYDLDFNFLLQAENPPEVLSAISLLLVDPAPQHLRNSAVYSASILLTKASHLTREAQIGDNPVTEMVDVSANHFLVDSSRQVLEAFQRGDAGELRPAITALRRILRLSLPLAERNPAWSPQRESAVAVCFIAMLTMLQSPDVDQHSLNVDAIRDLVRLNRSRSTFLSKLDPDTNTPQQTAILASNIGRADALNAFASLPIATGRQQQQRQLRKVIRAAARPSALQAAVWLGFYRRWQDLTAKITEGETLQDDLSNDRRRGLISDLAGLNEVEAKEWQNLTAMLAAMGAACTQDQSSLQLSDLILDHDLPRGYDDPTQPATAMQLYIQRTADFLVSESVYVRETVKDALGSDLPVQLYRPVVQQISALLSHAFEVSGAVRCSEPFSIFVEQSIAMLRLAIGRIGQPGEAAFLDVDLGDVILKFAQYLHRLGRGTPALRIKIRLCQLCEIMFQKDHVVLSNGSQVRNALLEWFSDWTQEVIVDGDTSSHSDLGAVERLQHELEVASLRAIVACSDGLVLQPTGSDSQETHGSMKSRLFYRHFQFLSRLLNRPPTKEEVSPRHTPSLSSRATAKPLSLDSRDSGQLKDLAVIALSNLLSSNVDVGLKHSLSMGYHDDEAIRVAFMHVLSNILRQGTHFTGLAGKRTSTAERTFLDILTQSDLSFAVAICETCPSSDFNEMSHLLIRSFEQRGTLLHLLKALIEKEVVQTQSESELFRANSLVTRLLSTVARMHGYNYVRLSLQPLIQSLCDKPNDYSFELDPVKLDAPEDAERNVGHLKVVCQALLDIICSSGPRVPVLFRAIGHHIWEVVGARFPDSRHSAVGAFIFLRFFCPAIVAPESVDLDMPAEPHSKDVRRALLMITKVIQNLANNVVFGNKEPFMKVLNPFLSENIRQVTKFLSDIAIRPRTADVAARIAKLASLQSAGLTRDSDFDEVILHRYVAKHIDRLEIALNALPSSAPNVRRSDKRTLNGPATLMRLRKSLLDHNLPAEHVRFSASAREQAYDEFMRQNGGRNVEPVAGAFYEGPMSQNGRRVFYLIVARAELVDYDLLAFHVYQTLDNVTDLFNLIIDLTGFSLSNDVPISWLKQTIILCPPGILPCLDVIVLYNPNTYARKSIHRHITELSSMGIRGAKTLVAACSPSELADHVAFTSLTLPDSTLALSYDADHVFTNVQLISEYEMEVSVVLKLGTDCLQVASWKRQDLSPQLKSYVIDVIRLEDIDDIISGSSLPPDHLVIKHSQTQMTTLVTSKRDHLSQYLRTAKSQLKSVPKGDRVLRPSDVPGTLLNVALLNMSSADPVLRVAAYDLVAELTRYFQYELNSQVLSARGMYIPRNASDFIVQLSQKLAETAPHLSLEFFREWAIGFSKAEVPQKTVCIRYLVPWIPNLVVYCDSSREDRVVVKDKVRDIVRSLIYLTASEREGLHLIMQDLIWKPIALLANSFVDLVTDELLKSAVDAGIGSDQAANAADTLVSVSSVAVRGRVIARLRKILAQTYLKPSATLRENHSWDEICALTRVNMVLSFSPHASASQTQLFLPEILHVVTLLVSAGPLLMRVSVHAIVVDALQSLATLAPSGEVDIKALHALLAQVAEPEMLRAFGLMRSATGLVMYPDAPRDNGPDTSLLNAVEKVTMFLSDVIRVGSATADLANMWRARWMGLVAATCFQHNPATQPQAFIVLGSLARDDIDDDLVYQILVALRAALLHFAEANTVLVIAMLRCLSRVVLGLSPESRYASSMFWLSVAVLQLGHLPTYTAGVELLNLSLQAMRAANFFDGNLEKVLLQARQAIGDPTRRLDQVAGVSFETSMSFSLAALLYKGLRHPATRTSASSALSTLLELSTETVDNGAQLLYPVQLGYFFALIPVLSSTSSDIRKLFTIAGLPKDSGDPPKVTYNLISLPDNSTAVMLITFVTAILNNASSDIERIILYRFLAEAAVEIPEVVSIAYDGLMPRMTAILNTTSNPAIMSAVCDIMERAIIPKGSLTPSSSFGHHPKSSIASSTFSQPPEGRDQVLDDLGMKGLTETSFPTPNLERVSTMAKWVATLIQALTA